MTATQRVQQKVLNNNSKVVPIKSFAEAVNEKSAQTATSHAESSTKSEEPTNFEIWKAIKIIQNKLVDTERKLNIIGKSNMPTKTNKRKKNK